MEELGKTLARPLMLIYGSDGKSGILQLSQEEPGALNTLFSRGNSDVFVLYVNKSLGSIQGGQIRHDNFGDNPSWYLEESLIRDVKSKQLQKFMDNQWFVFERKSSAFWKLSCKTLAKRPRGVAYLDFSSSKAKKKPL